MKITYKYLSLILISVIVLACNNPSDQKNKEIAIKNKGHQLIYNTVQKLGTYNDLLNRKDVSYTYTYTTPDGKSDISHERYLFDGEYSYGKYVKHERTLTQLEGIIEQGYDGKEYWLKHNGSVVDNSEYLKRVAFNRPTNFYWFAMMQKLLDPGLIYEHLGEDRIEGEEYDIVKVSFTSADDKPTDIYQVYINKQTKFIDQFLFTVADFGKMETPFLMKVNYEEVDGIWIPTKRKYKASTWDASVSDDPWINVVWTDIKFNNNYTINQFKSNHRTMDSNTTTSLKSKLDAKKASFEMKADDNKKRIYADGLDAVRNSGIIASAKQKGDQAPDFALTNAIGQTVKLSTYLKQGPVVLTWYRGGWCPYCNLTLHQLQEELPNFKAHGATLIALTPELPDKSITTAEKNDIQFEVLSDVGNGVARDYGIVFQLTEEVAEIYNQSFDMNGYNGDESDELPLAATYIIDTDGKIVYAYLDADYRNRAEPSEITKMLESL